MKHSRPGQVHLVAGRNAVLEALRAGRRFLEVLVDELARPQEKLGQITALAGQQGVATRPVPRAELDRLCPGLPHQGVVGRAAPVLAPSLAQVLEQCWQQGRDPCLVLLRQVSFQHNLGAVLRTADACGVSAVVVPSQQGAALGTQAVRVAMGASEHVPVLRQSLLAAAAVLRRAGLRLVAADSDQGRPPWDTDLTGPLALVLGGEHAGVSDPLRTRCHELVRVPLQGHVTSLNVSVACGMLLYERLRQEGKVR